MGARKRPQGKNCGAQEAVEQRKSEIPRMQCGRDRQRQQRPEYARDDKRQRRAHRQSRKRRQYGKRQHLNEIDRKHA